MVVGEKVVFKQCDLKMKEVLGNMGINTKLVYKVVDLSDSLVCLHNNLHEEIYFNADLLRSLHCLR